MIPGPSSGLRCLREVTLPCCTILVLSVSVYFYLYTQGNTVTEFIKTENDSENKFLAHAQVRSLKETNSSVQQGYVSNVPKETSKQNQTPRQRS